MGKQISINSPNAKAVWGKLNVAWALFFLCLGALNLYVAFQFSEEAWVNFKLFGSTGLLLIFVVAQGVWLTRHMDIPNK